MKKLAIKARNYFYKLFNTQLNNSVFGNSNELLTGSIYNSFIGNNNYLGKGVIINNAQLGDYCSIAAYSQIGGMEHSVGEISTSTKVSKPKFSKEVIIGDDVWIGAGVYVRSGITLGKGSVVGAGAVVLNDVPAYTIVVGVPARKLRDRFTPDVKKSLMGINFKVEPSVLKKLNENFSIRRR